MDGRLFDVFPFTLQYIESLGMLFNTRCGSQYGSVINLHSLVVVLLLAITVDKAKINDWPGDVLLSSLSLTPTFRAIFGNLIFIASSRKQGKTPSPSSGVIDDVPVTRNEALLPCSIYFFLISLSYCSYQ